MKMNKFKTIKIVVVFLLSIFMIVILTRLWFDSFYEISPTLHLISTIKRNIIIFQSCYILFVIFKISRNYENKNMKYFSFLYSLPFLLLVFIYTFFYLRDF